MQEGSEKLDNKGYDIEFSNVGFSYDTGDEVLKDVSFVAKQGEVTLLSVRRAEERQQFHTCSPFLGR